jgi:hypothetical protein
MKRWGIVIAAAAAVCVAASRDARAGYQIIRWTSGYCQIWDAENAARPFPSDYRTGRKTFRTFGEASVARARLISQRQCH